MSTDLRCPKCGLVQASQSTCKQCGTALPLARPVRPTAGPAPGSRPAAAAPGQRFGARHVLVGALILAGVAGGWAAVHWAQPRSREAERRGALRREVPAATPALQALRGLQSVTRAGLTFRDYTPRLLDATVQVDRYTAAPGGLPEVKAAMQQAMALYVLAGQAWSFQISENYEQGRLASDPALRLCPPVMLAAWGPNGTWDYREEAVADRVNVLFGCASARVEEAARLLQPS